MKPSPGVAQALRRFYQLNTANAREALPDILSGSESVLFIGSSGREWFAGQQAAHKAFGLEGLTIEPGEIAAYEEGSAGWAYNKPVFVLPNGVRMRMRMTTIFLREDGKWKICHIHGSTPVPDEVFLEHQAEWWPAA